MLPEIHMGTYIQFNRSGTAALVDVDPQQNTLNSYSSERTSTHLHTLQDNLFYFENSPKRTNVVLFFLC